MNRYSRINSKSKSVPIDFSDHLSLSMSKTPPIISKLHEEKSNTNDKCIQVMNGEEGDGEIFGVILSRSRSLSSYKSMADKERSSLMKRSSSSSVSSSAVRGGYCRIHHQNGYPISHEQTENINVVHRKKEKGNILRACMRLLRF
ncbi:unnamed protein product [Withania somnifera]